MPKMICPGCAGHLEYKKGEWQVKCPYCDQWRLTGEPKPPEPKPPEPKPPKPEPPKPPGLTETVEHYLERLRKWRLNCLKIILLSSLIFFGGAVLYLKGDPEIAMPVVLLGAAMYLIAPRLFANSRPRPLGPPASEKFKVPPAGATEFGFILIDIAVGAAVAFTAIQIFGPFVWK